MTPIAERRSRSSSSTAATPPVLVAGALAAALAAAPLAPDRAAAQGRERSEPPAAEPDSGVAARLEATAAHLQQMLRTLRENPELSETWSRPSVLEAAASTGRRSAGTARSVARLSAHLDSLLRSRTAARNEALTQELRGIQRSVRAMASSLRSVAGRLEALRSVVHGEGGAAGGHARAGGGEHAHGSGQQGGHAHREGAGHHAGLHFAHPLFTESVSPDSKVEVDYAYRDLGSGEGTKSTFGFGLEYAPTRSLSVQAGVPYSATDGAVGFTHLGLKFANYAFEEQGISLGYGFGVGLPTSGDAPEEGHHHGEEGGGHGHGTLAPSASRGDFPPARANGGGGVHGSLGKDFYELEPFFNIGWKSGGWELVGFSRFAIPSGLEEPSEGGTEYSWNVSALVRASPRVQALLELDGTHGLSGHPVGEDVVNLSPGIKVRPAGGTPLWIGVGGSLPLTEDQAHEGQLQVSLFYHFRRH